MIDLLPVYRHDRGVRCVDQDDGGRILQVHGEVHRLALLYGEGTVLVAIRIPS